MSPKSLLNKKNMDGDLMLKLHGNLNVLSDKSFTILLKYFKTGSLSYQEKSLLQSEITNAKDMWKVPRSRDSKTLIPPHETT
jgi:hypothetical protein